MSIEKQLRDIKHKIEDEMLEFAKDIAEDTFDAIIDATPVRTGNAAFQYRVSFNASEAIVNMPISIGGSFTKAVSKAKAKNKINKLKLGQSIHLTNSTHYIVDIMERQHSPQFMGNWKTLVQAMARSYNER